MRRTLAIIFVACGFALQFVSYFFLAAPIGKPADPSISNPRVPLAPALFILGVILVFCAAIVYELMPERNES